MLVLNATTLNTGHTWQFAASFMGEPPGQIDAEIDANYRLRRMYFWEARGEHCDTSLGTAVAASACVPGLFRPLVLKRLYPAPGESSSNEAEDLVVRLVDGGVRDNQGILSLLEQDCRILIVSDASGQMEAQDNPSWTPIGVPLRSNSILQATVRSNLYRELSAHQRSLRIRELAFLHLKKDLAVEDLDWRKEDRSESRSATAPEPTPYGIPEPVQRALAGMRTDLDSFSDREAHALMLSGYRMAEHYVPAAVRSLPLRKGRAECPFSTWKRICQPRSCWRSSSARSTASCAAHGAHGCGRPPAVRGVGPGARGAA